MEGVPKVHWAVQVAWDRFQENLDARVRQGVGRPVVGQASEAFCCCILVCIEDGICHCSMGSVESCVLGDAYSCTQMQMESILKVHCAVYAAWERFQEILGACGRQRVGRSAVACCNRVFLLVNIRLHRGWDLPLDSHRNSVRNPFTFQ